MRAADAADCLYLHDLSVARRARGSGVAALLIEQFFACMHRLGLAQARLTAVNGSAPYWARRGFQALPVQGPLAALIEGYGPDARYMAFQRAGSAAAGP